MFLSDLTELLVVPAFQGNVHLDSNFTDWAKETTKEAYLLCFWCHFLSVTLKYLISSHP